MARVALGLVIGIALGVAAARYHLGAERAPRSFDAGSGLRASRLAVGHGQRPSVPADSDCDGLRASLALESEMRTRLAEQVARLEQRLAEQTGTPSPADLTPEPPPFHGPADRGSEKRPDEPWFGDRELLALGMDAREVERVRLRWEQYTMDRLYLADASARGERSASRHARLRELMEIERDLRDDLGEESYDAMLYATDAKNRVVLTDVLESSPAFGAGVRAGDELIRYAGRRVWRPRALQSLTAAGKAGEIVEIQVLRNGELLRFFVERGPLGVRLGEERRPPFFE